MRDSTLHAQSIRVARKGPSPKLLKGQVYQRMTDPIMLLVARVRIAGRSTLRNTTVQIWLGGDRWGKVRHVRTATFLRQRWTLVEGRA